MPSWPNWVNNSMNIAALGAYEVGGSMRLMKSGSISLKWYENAWMGNQYAKTYNLSRLGTEFGYGTSLLSAGIGFTNFIMSDKSWGDYGQLGISLLSAGLTLDGLTAPAGIGIGFVDAAGGFNGFYNFLDADQQFYNSTGVIMLPINGIQFIPLKR